MLPKEFSGDKEAWRRKWRAKQKQIEAEGGHGADAGSGDLAPNEGEVGDGENHDPGGDKARRA